MRNGGSPEEAELAAAADADAAKIGDPGTSLVSKLHALDARGPAMGAMDRLGDSWHSPFPCEVPGVIVPVGGGVSEKNCVWSQTMATIKSDIESAAPAVKSAA